MWRILILLPSVLTCAAGADAPYTYQILYTGRTLGYARVPDEQTIPASNTGVPNAIAKEFLDQFKAATRTDIAQLRLAMGDNFSPELFARTLRVAGGQVKACPGSGMPGPNASYAPFIHLPKDYFSYGQASPGYAEGWWSIWCDPNTRLVTEGFRDNVADFLIAAHYDAVVPGKHDFYFGPQYLAQIAGYLAEAERPVHMLGDNLIVASALASGPMNAHPRIPERLANSCHYDTGKDHDCYHTDFGPASLDLPDNVLPWKRQFVLHGARRARNKYSSELFRQDELGSFKDQTVQYTELFCPESVEIVIEPNPGPTQITSSDPAKTLRPGAIHYKLISADQACTGTIPAHLQSPCQALYSKSRGKYDRATQAASTDETFLFRDPAGHLEPGKNHMFCVKPANGVTIFGASDVRICQPFTVQVPLFWPTDANQQPVQNVSLCKEGSKLPCPYALVNRDGLQVAVFAVIDPDLLSNIGMLNTVWWNRDQAWDTAVQVTAPDYALLQVLELCNASDDCRTAPKVLMAQMSYARATQLVANSNFSDKFDVVVTQSSPEHDTGNIAMTYQGTTPRFALTPPLSVPPAEQAQGTWSTDATQAQGRRMSISVFEPQVYVATIKKEEAPKARAFDNDLRAFRKEIKDADDRNCRIGPPKGFTPTQIDGLPHHPAAKSDPVDFGPCWSLSNISARWLEPPEDGVQFRRDLKKFEGEPPKDFCAKGMKGCMNLDRMARRYLAKHGHYDSAQADPVTAAAASDAFSQAVLYVMRASVKADVAMLQTRDLYDADNQSYEGLTDKQIQDQISRIVWKGDEVVVLHVTGATIRKLLKQSAAFATLDKNSLNTEIEKGRSLVTLGIYTHPKDPDTYYINGAAMVDTALYTIAASDFISEGDTGYSNLVPPDVLPAFRVHDFAHKRIHPIAGLVCRVITTLDGDAQAVNAAKEDFPNWPTDNVCADMQVGKGYFDESRIAPMDSTPGFDTLRRFESFPRNFLGLRRPFANTEDAVQQRHFWSLKLENLDFSETGVMIRNLKNTATNLAGVSNPLLATKGSQNIGADHKARLIYDYRLGTFYVLSDSSFIYQSQRSYTPPTQTLATAVSLSNNLLGSESGGTLRLPIPGHFPSLKKGMSHRERPSWLSAQYSVRYERELIDPFDTQFTITPPSSGFATSATLHPPRISTVYGRVGLRAENNDTYLETGVEEIDSRGLIQAYTIPLNGAIIPCQPDAANQYECATPNGPVKLASLPIPGASSITPGLVTTSYLTSGAYLNFFWKFPIFSRRDANRADQSFYFTLTNKGDIYFPSPSDTPVQTRYLDKLTPALSLPIWAGLTLTPKVDVVFYQNKIAGTHYLAIQPSFAISYTFTWRQGMDWNRALKYGAQTTTPSAAGSTH